MGTLRDLSWLTQLGFSIVSPLLLCVLGSVWLRDRYSLGPWILILGIFLGLGGALSAGTAFYRAVVPREPKKKKESLPAFNEHE